MAKKISSSNSKFFSTTFKVDRNLFLFYEFLLLCNDSFHIDDFLFKKKLNDLIDYLSSLIYQPVPDNYAYINEELFIKDVFQKEKE